MCNGNTAGVQHLHKDDGIKGVVIMASGASERGAVQGLVAGCAGIACARLRSPAVFVTGQG